MDLSNYFENSKDIELFLSKNNKNIIDTELYHSGGGIWIYYILIDNKIYSICDEILDDKNSDCIIYHGFKSIDEFLDYEEEWDSWLGEYNSYDSCTQEFIKIGDYKNEK